MLIKALIVDDEPLARARLSRLLNQLDSVEVVGAADNGQQAISMVEELSPNLVLMDVQMPKMNGIEASTKILELFDDDPPAIIFCTAYDQYAIDAFKVNASDHLLKPVSVTDLEDAIGRACQISQLRKSDFQDEAAYLSIKHLTYVENKPIDQICYFRSEGKNVVAGTVDGQETFVDLTLKELEQKFVSKMVRVHRNSLVSRDKLKRLVRSDEGDYVELSVNDKTFQVSRRMMSEVKKCFV